MKIRYSFHLYGSELTSGNEYKRPSITTKDVLIALITKEIPRDLGALSQEPWIKSKYIYEKYTLVILIIKYIFFRIISQKGIYLLPTQSLPSFSLDAFQKRAAVLFIDQPS